MLIRYAALAGLMVLTACIREKDPGMSTRDLMAYTIEPSAQAFWKASGWVDTEAGTISLAPKTQDGWEQSEASLREVEYGARLLRRKRRSLGRADWIDLSRQLEVQAVKTRAAVRARDEEAMFATGGDLYLICTACHQKYLLPLLGPDGQRRKIDAEGAPILDKP